MDERAAKDRIEKYWDKEAKSFDEEHSKEDKCKWKEYFQSLLGMPGTQKVLDVGTGTGFLAIMAAELGFFVSGIDFSEKMLEIARKKTKERELDIFYIKGDFNELPFDNSSFDYVVNSRVLWTVTDPEKVLTEWKRVLKKGGQLLNFLRLTDKMRVETPLEIYGSEVQEHLQLKSSSGSELIALCHAAGFDKVDLVKLPGIAVDAAAYGEWYVLRAMESNYEQERAVDVIRDFWNRRSTTYEDQHELTSLDVWKEYMKELIGPDLSAKILDLATGTGMIANLLGEMGYTCVKGMDISENMMDIARQHAKEKNTGVTFVYGNALELPLEDSSVDVLVNCRLLWTLLEPATALEEWIRVVKPGGKIISLHEMEEDYKVEEDVVWQHFLYGKNADPYMELSHATKSDYLELFKNSGLTKVKLVHMKGCQTLENGKNNWYALVGYKKEEK